MNQTIKITIKNDTQTQEETNTTARKFLEAIVEKLIDEPEIQVVKPNDYEINMIFSLPDHKWLDAIY